LNRAKLAEMSFSDPSIRKRVEAILHPLIQALALQRTSENSQGVTVYTIPLLVETKSPLKFDKVVTISCPEEVRLERLIKRGLRREDATKRISAQASDNERERVADLVIDSNCSLEELLVRSRSAYGTLVNG
jgi:dephospho-CoA kinase